VGAACVLGFLLLVTGVLLGGFALSRAIAEQRKHRVERSPAFQAAMRNIERLEFDKAVKSLNKLVGDDPESCLLNLYLSFALRSIDAFEAENFLRAALAPPDAERTLSVWAKDHPHVAGSLAEFAADTFERIDQWADDLDDDNPVKEEKIDREVRQPGYKLGRKALKIAEKLDSASPEIQGLLARTELVFGDYRAAHDRLSQLIRSGKLDSRDVDVTFFTRKLRGRATFLWVERLRDQGVALNDSTLQVLEEGRKDLELCGRFLMDHPFSKESFFKEYRVLHDKVRLMLTLEEVEMDLARLTDAEKHLRRARSMFDELTQRVNLAKSSGLRVPNIDQLAKRMTDDLRKLKEALSSRDQSQARPSSGSSAQNG
jgi:hypothetical protein